MSATTELALLPDGPGRQRRRAARGPARSGSGSPSRCVITDTMGRAWRNGQTDAAIGAAGLPVLHGYAGAVDRHGNELLVTEVAVADEIAAAADLVKGKLDRRPGRGGARTDRAPTTARPAATCCGPARTTCSGSAPPRRSSWGRRAGVTAAPLGAPVRRRPGRARSSIEDAVAEALTAPAPHHTRPVRFVWLPTRSARTALLDRMATAVAGRPGRRRQARRRAIERRVARGQILYDAPEVVIPFMVPDGAHNYPDARRTAAEHTMFTVAAGAAVQGLLVALAVRGVGSCWIGSTIFAPDLVRAELDLPADWEPLGAIAIGYPPTKPPASRPRPPADTATDCWSADERARLGDRAARAAGRRPTRARTRCGNAVLAFVVARPDACDRACVPGHITASAVVLDHTGSPGAADPAPAAGPLGSARRPLRARRCRHRRGRAARGHRGVRHRRPAHRPGPGRRCMCTRSPARWACRPATSTCSSSRCAPAGRRHRGQRRVTGPALVAGRRACRPAPITRWRIWWAAAIGTALVHAAAAQMSLE